jgi:hypothetical protein
LTYMALKTEASFEQMSGRNNAGTRDVNHDYRNFNEHRARLGTQLSYSFTKYSITKYCIKDCDLRPMLPYRTHHLVTSQCLGTSPLFGGKASHRHLYVFLVISKNS